MMGLPVYNFDQPVTFTVYKGTETDPVASEEYSLAKYISIFDGVLKDENATEADKLEAEINIAPAKALYMFAKIAKDYKVITDDEK